MVGVDDTNNGWSLEPCRARSADSPTCLGIFRLTLRFNQVILHCGKVGKEHLIWVHLKALVQTHTLHFLLACSPIGSEDSQRMTICLTWPSLADVPSKA